MGFIALQIGELEVNLRINLHLFRMPLLVELMFKYLIDRMVFILVAGQTIRRWP